MIHISELTAGQIVLLSGPRYLCFQHSHALMVQAALQRPLRVLVGGNRFSVYDLAYALAARTGEYEEIMRQRIHLARAETCYQMAELLIETETLPLLTLVTDLTSSFYDPGVPESEIDQLLFRCIAELRRLSQAAPLLVSASPGPVRPRLLKALEKAAARVVHLQPLAQPAAYQRSLVV